MINDWCMCVFVCVRCVFIAMSHIIQYRHRSNHRSSKLTVSWGHSLSTSNESAFSNVVNCIGQTP